MSKPVQPAAGLESVDLTLRLIELLASSKVAKGVTEVALELGISKTRAHRHLRCLVELGYAYQDPRTDGYEVGIRVLALGEMVRDRFDIARLLYPVMARLGELSGFAVTLAGSGRLWRPGGAGVRSSRRAARVYRNRRLCPGSDFVRLPGAGSHDQKGVC